MAGRFSLSAVFKAVDDFTRPIAKMENRYSQFAKTISKSIGRVDQFNSKISAGMQRTAVVGSAAGVAMGVAANNVIGAGADFEQAIADVGAVSLKTRDQIAALEKKALELGATTRFSATEVAKGMELMGRAGFEDEQILAGISGVLSAAAAEGAELAEVTGIISNVMKGMGLEMTDTNRVADVLALASARTNSSITSLGESMSNVSATARQFKVPLEDTVAAVALLQDVGLDASEAGTAMATMLTKLSKPSDDVAAQMANMGVKFQDAHGNMLPLTQIFGQFEKASKKSGGNMKQAAFFAELVGLRGQKAALNLKDLFMKGEVGKLTKELEKAKGSAEKMAELRMQSFRGDLEQLGGAVETVKIGIFNLNSGPLRGVVQGMTKWIEKNRLLVTSKLQDFIVAIVSHLAQIWLWTKRVAFGIAVFYAWQIAVKAATVATVLWQVAMAAASLGAAALGAVLGLLEALTTGWVVALMAATAWTWLKNAALTAYNAVVWLGVAATTAWTAITRVSTYQAIATNAIMTVLRAAFIAYNAVMAAGAGIVAIYNAGGLLAVVRLAAWTVALYAVTAAQAAWNFVMSINPMFLLGAAIIGLIALVLKLSGGWDFLKAKFKGFVDAAVAKIQPLIDKVMKLWSFLKQAGSALGGFLELGANVGDGTAPPGFVNAPAEPVAPLMGPSDGVSRSIEETNFVSRGEVTIRDESGRAQVTKAPSGPGFGLTLQPSGSF